MSAKTILNPVTDSYSHLKSLPICPFLPGGNLTDISVSHTDSVFLASILLMKKLMFSGCQKCFCRCDLKY